MTLVKYVLTMENKNLLKLHVIIVYVLNVLNNYIKVIIVMTVQYAEKEIGLIFNISFKIKIVYSHHTVLNIQIVYLDVLHHHLLLIYMVILIALLFIHLPIPLVLVIVS